MITAKNKLRRKNDPNMIRKGKKKQAKIPLESI